MIKKTVVYAVTVFAIISWIGIFFPPEIGGTPTRTQLRTETVCVQDCPGHRNSPRALEHD